MFFFCKVGIREQKESPPGSNVPANSQKIPRGKPNINRSNIKYDVKGRILWDKSF